MFSTYRNGSIASFGSADSSSYDPSMSTPSLSLTPDLASAHENLSNDFWNATLPSSSDIALPVQSINGIVNVFSFTPQHGEPKTRISVNIGFRQLPGRVIGLRIVFGTIGLRTHVAHGHKRGHWQLRAEVPDVPSSISPSSHVMKVDALEGEVVIDSAEFGRFSLWDAGTMPANVQNQSMLSRRVRSFDHRVDGGSPHAPRSSTQPYRGGSSIASTLAAAVSAPSLTTQPISSSPAVSSPLRPLTGNPDAYRIVRRTEIPIEREASAVPVVMTIHGDVRAMSTGWSPEDMGARRRLVQFWRHMDGPIVNVHFCPIQPEEYDDSRIVVSCIYREDADKCFITSFDLIRLLEGIIGSVCNIDEKNRIRRNVHHIEHDTISKSKPFHEEFFDLIMSFPAPMPRRNVRDLKAFRWEFLPDALHAIMDKMALDYNPKAVSEMIEPSIPEGPEDSSMPSFSNTIHSEPDRRDSGFSVDGGFSFRRPSMQSALSFDTVSPNSSVASFHNHHSPSASLSNFHLNHSPNASVGSFHGNGMLHFQPSRSPVPNANGVFQSHQHQSPSASVSSFHNQHLSPSASVSSFNLGQQSNGLSNYLAHAPGSSLLGQDNAMDLSGGGTHMMGFAGGMAQGTPTGSYSNLKLESGFGAEFFGTDPGQQQLQQQHQLNRVASQSSLEGALGGFYMS